MIEQPVNDEGFTEHDLWQRLDGQVGTERASTLIDLGFIALQRSDHEQALALADAAIDAAKDFDNDQVAAQAYRSRGVTLNNLDRYEEAAAAHQEAAKVLERFDNLHDLADVYLHVSWNLESAQQYEPALEYAHNALRTATEAEEIEIVGRAHWQIADLLTALKTTDDVMHHLEACRTAWRDCENILGVLDVQGRIASVWVEEGRYDDAIALLTDCLHVAESLTKQPAKAPYCAFSLAHMHRLNGNPERARELLQIPLRYNSETGEMAQLGSTYKELAACEETLGDIDEALTLLDKARAHFEVISGHDGALSCLRMRAGFLHNNKRYLDAAEANRQIEDRTEGLNRYWARSRRIDNVRAAGDLESALELINNADDDALADTASAAWFWRHALIVQVLGALGRTTEAAAVSMLALGQDLAEADAGSKAVFFEATGNSLVDDDIKGARHDWAQAIALYMKAGMHSAAERLSERYLA